MATWLKDTTLNEETKQKDFSHLLATQVPLAQNLADAGKLSEACELMLAVEKQSRVASDLPTLKEACLNILRLCFEHKDFSMLTEQVVVLAKRRAQKSAAVTIVVQKAMEYLQDIPSEDVKVELIVALRSVTDGKIYVEKERAQLTQQLSQVKEKNGDISGAADILQEVHVETYGAMTKLEKCEFILEQVRLTLEKKDYIRAYILSKKILRRTLEEAGFDACKLKFYRLMIQYHTHENDTLELCRHWQAIFATPSVQEDPAQWKEALQHAVIFAILSAHSNHQNDILYRLVEEKRLKEMEEYYSLITRFTTKEVISFPFAEYSMLKCDTFILSTSSERGVEWLKDLRTRVVEHNIRVIADYYDRIRMADFAKILDLAEEETEIHTAALVSNGTIYAKIDRPGGIVNFCAPEAAEKQLSSWAGDIGDLLNLVETTCHLINKETMTYKV